VDKSSEKGTYRKSEMGVCCSGTVSLRPRGVSLFFMAKELAARLCNLSLARSLGCCRRRRRKKKKKEEDECGVIYDFVFVVVLTIYKSSPLTLTFVDSVFPETQRP
jgi:hypothetical protein